MTIRNCMQIKSLRVFFTFKEFKVRKVYSLWGECLIPALLDRHFEILKYFIKSEHDSPLKKFVQTFKETINCNLFFLSFMRVVARRTLCLFHLIPLKLIDNFTSETLCSKALIYSTLSLVTFLNRQQFFLKIYYSSTYSTFEKFYVASETRRQSHISGVEIQFLTSFFVYLSPKVEIYVWKYIVFDFKRIEHAYSLLNILDSAGYRRFGSSRI